MRKVTQNVAGGKRGPYKCRPALPSEISNYASQHGAAAAAWHFFEKAGGARQRVLCISMCLVFVSMLSDENGTAQKYNT